MKARPGLIPGLAFLQIAGNEAVLLVFQTYLRMRDRSPFFPIPYEQVGSPFLPTANNIYHFPFDIFHLSFGVIS